MDVLYSWHRSLKIVLQVTSMHSFGKTKLLKFTYRTYKVLVVGSFMFLFVSGVLSLFLNERDSFLREFFNVLSLGINFASFVTIAFFHWHLDKMEGLLEYHLRTFKELGTGTRTDFHENCKINLEKWKITVNSFNIFQFFTCFSLTLLFICRAIKNKKRVLLLKLWLPFDWKQYPYFELLFTLQIVMQIIMALVWCGKLSYLAFSGICHSLKLRYAAHEISNCLYESLDEYNKKLKKRRPFNYIKIENILYTIARSKEFEKLFRDVFCKKTKMLQRIQECKVFSDSLDFLLSVDIAIRIVLIIVNTIFAFFVKNFLEKWFVLQYSLIMFLFLIGEFIIGEKVAARRKEVCEAIYNIPWYLCSATSQKMVLFSLLCTQNRRNLCLGKWIPLTFETFVKALKLIYSCITLAIHLISRNNRNVN